MTVRVLAAACWLVALVLAVGFAEAQEPAAAESAPSWLQRSQDARFPARDMRATFELRVERADGTTLERRGVALRRTQDRSLSERLFVLTEPASLAGIALLSKDRPQEPADQWLYLPAYRRARRVAIHGAGDAFAGSDFNYADLARVRIEAGEHRLLEPRAVAGRDCVVIETVNRDLALPYSKTVSTIDRQNGLPLRTEYYDREGVLQKIGSIDEVAEMDGWATPVVITMENRETGGKSVLRLREVGYDVGLEPSLFTVERLEQYGPPL